MKKIVIASAMFGEVGKFIELNNAQKLKIEHPIFKAWKYTKIPMR